MSANTDLSDEALAQKAARLHNSALVWDNHSCLPMALEDNLAWLPQIEKYRSAGCDLVSLNIGYGTMTMPEHLALITQMRAWLNGQSERYRMIERPSDIHAAKQAGQLGVTFDIEGAGVIDNLGQVKQFYDLGVRWMALAYNSNNRSAGGCHDEDTGLTGFGRELVAEMQRVGMVVCCSHVGYRTVEDVLAISQGPMIFSHSNPRGLWDHPRNVPDTLLKACAETGGVVGVNGLTLFMGQDASAARICDHLEYLLDLVGADHVGLGLDYCFDLDAINAEKVSMGSTFPKGLGYEAPVECFEIDDTPMITREMLGRGHATSTVEALLGRNWLRIAEACWR